eukprot:3340987-Prymnesium_polylepis.1
MRKPPRPLLLLGEALGRRRVLQEVVQHLGPAHDVLELAQPLVLGRVARRVDGRSPGGEEVVEPAVHADV